MSVVSLVENPNVDLLYAQAMNTLRRAVDFCVETVLYDLEPTKATRQTMRDFRDWVKTVATDPLCTQHRQHSEFGDGEFFCAGNNDPHFVLVNLRRQVHSLADMVALQRTGTPHWQAAQHTPDRAIALQIEKVEEALVQWLTSVRRSRLLEGFNSTWDIK